MGEDTIQAISVHIHIFAYLHYGIVC